MQADAMACSLRERYTYGCLLLRSPATTLGTKVTMLLCECMEDQAEQPALECIAEPALGQECAYGVAWPKAGCTSVGPS